MARLPIPGGDNGTWGSLLNDFLDQVHDPDGTLKSDVVTSDAIAPNAVTSAAIAPNAVTSDAIAPNSITNTALASNSVNAAIIADGSITNVLIADGTIQEAKLAATLQAKIDNPVVGDATPSVKGIVQLTGDLGGTAASPKVVGLQGRPVDGALPGDGQVLTYSTTSNTWVASTVTSTSVNDATTSSKGIIQLAGDLGGTSSSPTVPGLANKLDITTAASTYAPKASPTFTGTVTVPAPTNNTDAATKAYVDAQISSGSTPDATISSKGKIQLAGDLGGTSAAPLVTGINGVAVSGTPSNGKMLVATSASAASWTTPASAPVTSVAGKTGIVTLVAADITDASIVGKTLLTAADASAVKTALSLTKSDVGLANVDNTSDATKNSAVATLTNKTIDGASNTLTNIAQSSVTNLTTNLAAKAPLASPTFTGTVTVPTPTNNTDAATKAYVDTAAASGTPDATVSAKGKIQLAGDLGGTAASPTVPGLATKEPTITAGTNSQYWRGDKSWQTLDKSAVGLANVDNTSDAAKNSATVTLTNKTLDNTNIISIKDTNLTLQDESDSTKQAKFQLSSITTATTRTYTLPDASTTVVGTDATQTLTNKTIAAGSNTISGLGVTHLGGISGTPSSSNFLRGDGTWATASNSGMTRSVNAISTATNAGAAANTDYIYLVSGTTTLTLPTAVGNTNRYTVTNVGVNTVTVSTTGGQTINGSSSATLPIANMSLDFVSDGSNWVVE